MKEQKKNVSINHQDSPHQEGSGRNTVPINRGSGQRHSENRNQPMSNMMNESEEQKAGREKNKSGMQDNESGT